VALCDENGSGKSTLLGMLAGAIDASEGEIWIDGHSLRTEPLKAKAALAFVPDDCMAYPFQTGENCSNSWPRPQTTVDARVIDLAHRFGLSRIWRSASSRCHSARARSSS
jgi:heme-transporting ATPase